MWKKAVGLKTSHFFASECQSSLTNCTAECGREYANSQLVQEPTDIKRCKRCAQRVEQKYAVRP